jgi:hypothetical protein
LEDCFSGDVQKGNALELRAKVTVAEIIDDRVKVKDKAVIRTDLASLQTEEVND